SLTEMIEAVGSGQVRALYLMGENPVMSDPDTNHVRECLARAELIISQDIFLNETTEYAHVVLPAAAGTEKLGTYTNTERRVRQCLARAVFIISQDVFRNATTEYAHVVLPAAAGMEELGTYTNAERRVRLVRPALNPPGQARPDWQIIAGIARRMGAPGWD